MPFCSVRRALVLSPGFRTLRSGWVAAPTFAPILLVLLARRVRRRAVSGFPGASMEHPAGWFLRCRNSCQSRYCRCLASATQTRGERKPYGKGTTSESLKSRMRQGVGRNFRSGNENRVPQHLFRPVLLPLRAAAKPDSQWCFASQIGHQECARQCAVIVLRPVRALEGSAVRSPSPSKERYGAQP